MLLSNAVVLAESHPKPNINTFAEMRVKCNDYGYSFAFSKPVDRLFVIWTDGTGLQELYIDEDLRAYAFRLNHKYLAGIEEHYSGRRSLVEIYGGEKLTEDIQIDPATGLEAVRETRTYRKIQALEMNSKMEENIAKFKEKYKKYIVEIDMPEQMVVEVKDANGNVIEVPVLDENGDFVYTVGEMRAYSVKIQYYKTNIATPDQRAFVTLQDDEWVVYYNRSGKIVSVEHYENQF